MADNKSKSNSKSNEVRDGSLVKRILGGIISGIGPLWIISIILLFMKGTTLGGMIFGYKVIDKSSGKDGSEDASVALRYIIWGFLDTLLYGLTFFIWWLLRNVLFLESKYDWKEFKEKQANVVKIWTTN
ncbi:MAG: RDD family protein [Mollicutes bacterium PWAP]|nr:RDD family protein [Mollicutes bacterium PWAP]